MRDRLPLILSSCSLILVVFAATPLGNAATTALRAVPFAKSADYAKLAGNSTKLNGRKSTLSGAPGTIPVIGSNGKLPVSIGAVGPQGEKGKDGKDGKNGKNATTRWAAVSAGSIVASSGNPTLTHPSSGRWDLTFEDDISKCAIIATKNIYAADYDLIAYASATTLTVRTFSASPPYNFADFPFSAAALC